MRKRTVAVLLSLVLVPCIAPAAPIFWGLDEYRIATDYQQIGDVWHFGYEVSAAKNGAAVTSFEIDVDPGINPAGAVQSPVLPPGWTVSMVGNKIRFETDSNPIVPNTTLRFEYSSPFQPNVASATLFNNPPVWFDFALGPGVDFFDGRPKNAWIGLGGLGPWTTRQVRLNELIDQPDHKKIDADYLGQYSLAARLPVIGPPDDFPNSRAIVRYHHYGEGQPAPVGAPAPWQYDYLARNDSRIVDNNQGLTSPFDLYDRFAAAGVPAVQADGYISWTDFVGPPNGWPACPGVGDQCWDDPNWPDTVNFLGGRVDTTALGPVGRLVYLGQRAEGPFFGRRPVWAAADFAINPFFSPPAPFNFTPIAAPEPATTWLIGAGTFVWAASRRRRQRKGRG